MNVIEQTEESLRHLCKYQRKLPRKSHKGFWEEFFANIGTTIDGCTQNATECKALFTLLSPLNSFRLSTNLRCLWSGAGCYLHVPLFGDGLSLSISRVTSTRSKASCLVHGAMKKSFLWMLQYTSVMGGRIRAWRSEILLAFLIAIATYMLPKFLVVMKQGLDLMT